MFTVKVLYRLKLYVIKSLSLRWLTSENRKRPIALHSTQFSKSAKITISPYNTADQRLLPQWWPGFAVQGLNPIIDYNPSPATVHPIYPFCTKHWQLFTFRNTDIEYLNIFNKENGKNSTKLTFLQEYFHKTYISIKVTTLSTSIYIFHNINPSVSQHKFIFKREQIFASWIFTHAHS